MYDFNFLKVSISNSIATVLLNNPKKVNALNQTMWGELKTAFNMLSNDKEVKVCVIRGAGKHFSSGIDINYLTSIMEDIKLVNKDNQSKKLNKTILEMQESMSAIEDCIKPVIAAIHGACIGGAVDLISACDIRYSSYFSYFSIMETKLGIVADMGTLQRLPLVLSDGDLKELAYTSRIFNGYKAKRIGLVTKMFFSKTRLLKKSYDLAREISSLPSHAVEGTKKTINYSRDRKVSEGLEYIANLNSTLLMSPETSRELEKIKSQLKKK